jgi:hypothetical protein
MNRCVRWTIAGFYLSSLPFMRCAWELTGAKSPFLAHAIPLASGVALLLALLWRLVLIKREARIAVWLFLAAVCVVYALMFRALPQQIERVHLSQYALLSMLVFWAMGDGYEGYVLSIWAAIVTVELGLADECLQGLMPSRIYDLNDVVLNAKAALIGQAVIAFVLRPWERGGRNLKPVDARPAWPGTLWLWCAWACVILLAAFNVYTLELGTPTITQDVHRGDGAFVHRDGFLYFGLRAILLNAAVLAAATVIVVSTRRRPGERARSLRTAVTCGLLSPLVLLAGRLLNVHFR